MDMDLECRCMLHNTVCEYAERPDVNADQLVPICPVGDIDCSMAWEVLQVA